MASAEIDLVGNAVESESNRLVRGTSVEIVNKNDLDLLGHDGSLTFPVLDDVVSMPGRLLSVKDAIWRVASATPRLYVKIRDLVSYPRDGPDGPAPLHLAGRAPNVHSDPPG